MSTDYSLYRLIESETGPLNKTVLALSAGNPGLNEKLPKVIEDIYREAASDVFDKRARVSLAMAGTSLIPGVALLSEVVLARTNIMTVSLETAPALSGISPTVGGFALVMGIGVVTLAHLGWCSHKFDMALKSSPSDPNGYRDRRVFELTRERLTSMRVTLDTIAPK